MDQPPQDNTEHRQQPIAALDVNAVRAWLARFVHAPGLISICSTGAWAGQTFTNLDDAVEYVKQLDAAGKEGIYHRVTTLRERPNGGRGGADLSLTFFGLWADVDIDGPGHKPPPGPLPLPPDEDAARHIIKSAGLPPPTRMIHSGGGLYPWWLLDEPHIIDGDRPQLEELSTRWQQALGHGAETLGFHYGTGVGDLPRVLRIPGTVNRKAGLARPCQLLTDDGPLYTLDELKQAAPRTPPPPPTAAPPRPVTEPGRAQPSRELGPFDALAESAGWADLLQPLGWTYVGSESDGAELWKRPGATSDYSARCGHNGVPVMVVHSTDAGLPAGPGQKLTMGRVFAHFHHNGDEHAAARDLRAAAAGDPSATAARSLPPHVLANITTRCRVTPWTPPPADPDPWDVEDATAPSDQQPPAEAGPITPSALLLPDEFWEARPVLQHIRQAAHARNRSASVVLGGVLARIAAMLPPQIKADTGIGSPASANLFVTLIGASGTGKSSGAWIPRRLLPAPPGLDFVDELPLGSGEGIAEAYMGEREVTAGPGAPKKGPPKNERIQVRGNALFYADEGEALTKQLFGRNGTTIGESLRRAWTGGTIGQFNGKTVNTRVVAAGTYSLGMVIGFQPETALPLLDDVAAGTPQRFLWMSVLDPSISEEHLDEPGPLDLALFRHGFGRSPKFTFAAEILREIRQSDRDRATGALRLPPLDSHMPLMKVKLAALLAVLANRTDVTVEDWQLAEVMWNTSCRVRDALLNYGERQRAKEAETRTKAHVDREVRAHNAKAHAERSVERVARRAALRVRDAQGMTIGALRKVIAQRDRNLLSAAVDHAEARGWVSIDGDKITPGDSMPS